MPPMIPRVDAELWKALQRWRNRTADEQRFEPYRIFKNDTLDELASKKPRTRMELLTCKGIGPAKINKYGDAILSIIAAHLPYEGPSTPVPTIERLPDRHSLLNTLWSNEDVKTLSKMAREGKTDKQIAAVLGRSNLAIRMKREALHT